MECQECGAKEGLLGKDLAVRVLDIYILMGILLLGCFLFMHRPALVGSSRSYYVVFLFIFEAYAYVRPLIMTGQLHGYCFYCLLASRFGVAFPAFAISRKVYFIPPRYPYIGRPNWVNGAVNDDTSHDMALALIINVPVHFKGQ